MDENCPDIETIYNEFISSMKTYSRNHRISAKIVEARYEKIIRDFPVMITDESRRNKPIFDEYMSFYRWDNNHIVHYGEYHTSYNDLIQDIIFNHNKQYQWNLVIAFEAYEKYLKKITSYLVSIKNKHIISLHFSNNDLRNISEVEYLSIYNILQKDNKYPTLKLLSELRILLPNYANLELKNEKNINMKFMLLLIEEMRHHIVHTYGVITNRVKFLERILKKIGLYNNGKHEEIFRNILNDYFLIKKYPNEISLLEIPVILGFLVAKTDILGNLFQILLNSAYFITMEIKEKYFNTKSKPNFASQDWLSHATGQPAVRSNRSSTVCCACLCKRQLDDISQC
jgi:hypothetical protein